MTRTNLFAGAARWTLLIGLAALPLTGCKPAQSDVAAAPSSALPLAEAGAAITPAPVASALPPAAPVAVGHLSNRSDYYAFADHAYSQNEAFGDAPPDYGFDYQGTQPWVWRADDGAMRVAEALPGGGDRYYYYEPGSDYPYLVRDPQYSYGYDRGELVVIYDSRGHALPESDFEQRRDHASRFYARGRELYTGSQRERQAVAQPNWVERRGQYQAEQQSWNRDQQNDSEWRDYHAAHQQQEQSQFAAEQARRAAEAVVFAVAIHDNQSADRDRKVQQEAQTRAQQAGPPPSGSTPFHFGGPQGGQPVAQPAPAPVVAPQPGPGPAAGAPGDHGHHDHAGAGPAGAAAPTSVVPAMPAGATTAGEQGHHRDQNAPGAAVTPANPTPATPPRHADHPAATLATPTPQGDASLRQKLEARQAAQHAAAVAPVPAAGPAFQPGQGLAHRHENAGAAPTVMAHPAVVAAKPVAPPKVVEAKPTPSAEEKKRKDQLFPTN